MTVAIHDATTGQTSGLPRSARWRADRAALALVGVAIFVGFVLRVRAASGDLWLDEIWSLDLVAGLTSPDQVFWAISHDNNHFLNSLWMYLVGQTQPPIVYRLPSVVLGTATIGVAARIGWRINPATGVAAALITACSYPLVDYGSEARGYGTLILAIFLALGLGRRLLDRIDAGDPVPGSLTRGLGVTIGLGACAHLTMGGEACILGLATVLCLRQCGIGLRAALDRTLVLSRPVLVALLAVGTCILAGILVTGSFTVGGYEPFQPAAFVAGYGGLVSETLGVRSLVPPGLALVLAATLIISGFTFKLIDRRWTELAFASLVVWPALLFLCRLGNLEFPRYFLVAGMILLLLLAEMAGRLWTRSGFGRCCAVGLVAVICVGQSADVAELLTSGRGSPAAALAMIGAGQSVRIDARTLFAMRLVTDYYDHRPDRHTLLVTKRGACDAPSAPWAMTASDPGEGTADVFEDGPEQCRVIYAKVTTFPAALWSGRVYTVYKRRP